MKKTLIVLVALAGGAMAAEEALTLTSPANGSLESNNAAIAWSEDYTKLESWELSFDLVLKDSTYPSAAQAFFGTHTIDSGCEGYVLRITEDGAIQLGYRDNPSITTYITTSDDIVTTDKNFGITLKFVADVTADGTLKGGTFTLTCGEESHDYTLPQGTDGDYLTYTALEKNANSKFWTNSQKEKFYNISVTKLDSKLVVPEPTTATLSLLALAGLAARRRRK